MAGASHGGHAEGFLRTTRTDAWWVAPVLTVLGLGIFGVYATIVAFQASYYVAGPYLSPFYSPLLFVQAGVPGGAEVSEAMIGAWPAWWPSWLPASPAFWILPFPVAFRGTCYYYRKAYYRSFFGLPPACAVGPASYGRYEGETGLLIFQNLHRYTLYFALLLLPILFYEAFRAFFYHGELGVGVGSILLLVNASLLTFYTLGCHSFRHLIGGKLNCFSCDAVAETRHGIWGRVSWLNGRHMQFAWMSLGWFLLTDVYIRLCSMGYIGDLNTWSGF